MGRIPHLPWALIAAVLGAVLLAMAVTWLWRWRRRYRQRLALERAVTGSALEHLSAVMVPDGQGGELHIDYLLLTSRGVVVIDLRDVPGIIFGGDQMKEWTVMHRAQRKTFVNPQTGLYDRIAAIRALTPDVPVDGRIVFTPRGEFPKGLPRWTTMLDRLTEDLASGEREASTAVLNPVQAWSRIKAAATPSRLVSPKPAV